MRLATHITNVQLNKTRGTMMTSNFGQIYSHVAKSALKLLFTEVWMFDAVQFRDNVASQL